MKKSLITLTIMLAAAAMVAAFSCPALAQVSGQCDNCHTMHYSQGGVSTMYGADGPYEALLINDCLGCHTAKTSGDPYEDATPFVTGTNLSDDACCAGGFFPDTMGTGDNDDDHHGISVSQTNAPAGYDGSFYTGTTVGNGLGCAGSNGCHGNETDVNDMKAIKGGHHDTSLAYRMLYAETAGTLKAVEGDGATDYEELIISTPATTPSYGTNANLYCAGTASTNKATINDLCAKCHGVFHGGTAADTGTGSPWIRHPTENAISTDWTIGASTYTLLGKDIKDNPVGFDAATVDNAEKRVLCVSCHRAHGTDNDDLIRWPYTEMLAGQSTPVTHGCLGCHDAQQ